METTVIMELLESPFLTISKAAKIALPGSVITVYEGTYRERVSPNHGGLSSTKPIIYQAAPGQEVWIKGSEIIKKWKKFQGNVWMVKIDNKFFGDFNPYAEIIEGLAYKYLWNGSSFRRSLFKRQCSI